MAFLETAQKSIGRGQSSRKGTAFRRGTADFCCVPCFFLGIQRQIKHFLILESLRCSRGRQVSGI